MKQLNALTTPLLSLLLAACSGGVEPQPNINTPGADPCASVSNSIDGALCGEFTALNYHPLMAASDELCTRLSVDLLGRRPTPEERSTCASANLVDLVRSYQETDAYRLTQRRRWADRFSYVDTLVDPFQIRDLDQLIDRMYRGELTYSEFTVQAASHPAFVGRFIGFGLPEDVARAAFRIFLGRVATKPEAVDLAPLWSPWVAGGFYRGYDETGYPYGSQAWVDTAACEKNVRSCASTLLGDAVVETEKLDRVAAVAPETLSDADWEALRAPGRLFVSLDIFWEAQVDEVLEHFLGYDLGTLRPSVRDALVRDFRQHQNITQLEREVVTSIAYLQSSKIDPDHEIPEAIRSLPLAHGPSKLMTPEAWLKSVGSAIGANVGDCDFRYPSLPSNLYDPYTGGPVDFSELDDFWPRKVDGSIDRTFAERASAMGGCPGQFDYFAYKATTRSTYMGLIAAVGQEEAALSLCLDAPATNLVPAGVDALPQETQIEQTVAHLFTRLFGSATQAEITEATERAVSACPECTPEQVSRQLCTGVAAGIEYIFQ